MNTPSRFTCPECGKGFGSEVELRIHQKCKHSNQQLLKCQNVNSSDLSEDEEESIKRFRKQFVKKAEVIPQLSNNQNGNHPEGNKDKEDRKPPDADPKVLVLGRFDNPSVLQDDFKKIYLCGCQHKTFESSADLSLHISKQHNGFPPQGTLYGVSRDLVRRQFQPLQERPPVARPHIESTAFVCGCGNSYTRLSSLRHHIRQNHKSQTPFGTIGLTKGPLSRQQNDGYQIEPLGDLSDSRSSNDNRQEKKS